MQTYIITTTHGEQKVEGTRFAHETDELTGERGDYIVYNGAKIAAYIPAGQLVSILVEEHETPDCKVTLSIDDRAILSAIRGAEARYCRK